MSLFIHTTLKHGNVGGIFLLSSIPVTHLDPYSCLHRASSWMMLLLQGELNPCHCFKCTLEYQRSCLEGLEDIYTTQKIFLEINKNKEAIAYCFILKS